MKTIWQNLLCAITGEECLIHHLNLQKLPVEMFKIKNELLPPIVTELVIWSKN